MRSEKVLIVCIVISMLNAFSLSASDEWDLIGTYTSPFPHPFRFEIIDENVLRLDWTETGEEYLSWEESKNFKYTIREDSIFVNLQLSDDLPAFLWTPITGDQEPWYVGNVLLGLFGVLTNDASSDKKSERIMGITLSKTRRNSGSDVFTVDLPNYLFEMHGPRHVYPMAMTNPSSELKEGSTIYELRNLDVVRSGTAWVEGVDGDGIGESFELRFNKSPQHLAIINGYISAGNPSLYWKNGRIKTFQIEGLTTGTVFERTVVDTPNLQTIDIRELGDETHARIIIADVYPGELYSDTCLHFMSYSENAIRPLSIP